MAIQAISIFDPLNVIKEDMASIGSGALNEHNDSIEDKHAPLKFDAGDLLRFKLELALLVTEESPRLDTLCRAFYLLIRARESQPSLDGLMCDR